MRLLLSLCASFVCATHAFAFSHGITPFGELKYQKNFAHFEYVNPDAPQGGTLKLSHSAAFDNLNPFILKGVSAPGMGMVFETLMKNALDEPQSYYGLIAKSVQVAKNKRYADFILRKEARWHDGKPITADDVVFSFETLKSKGHPSYRIIYKPIEKVEKIHKHKVRFHFTDPENRELPILAASMNILPKHYYEDVAFDKTTLTSPLGSGPYKVKEAEAGRFISFEKADDYWAKDLAVNVGHYNFDEIRYDIYRDETVSLEAIKSGDYDVREEYIARNWATAYDIPAIEKGDLIKVKIPNKIPSGMQAFIYNTRSSKFSDVRVREAVALSLDYEWMNKTLFYGAYERSHSFFQNTDFMATGIPEGDELKLLEPYRAQLPEKLFTEPFKIPRTDGSGYPRKNLLKAQQLLNDAGWVMKDGARVHTETDEPLIIEFMMRQRTFERVVGGMVRNLEKLGIKARFRYVDDSQYQKRIDERDFDIISIWWNYGLFFPGNEQVSFWHSSQADVKGANNYSGMQSDVVDALVEKVTQASTLDELLAATHALDRVLLWKHVVIPHWHLGAWRLAYWNHLGRPEKAPSYGLALDTWWRLPEEQTKTEATQ